MAKYPDGIGQVNIGFDDTLDNSDGTNGEIQKKRKEGVVGGIYPVNLQTLDIQGLCLFSLGSCS